jgi:hypothetical protein
LELVKALIEEMRKPAPPTQKELDAIAQRQAERQVNASAAIEEITNQTNFQRNICTHRHNTGQSHCMLIKAGLTGGIPNHPDYMFCQNCRIKVYPEIPEEQRRDRTASAVYDNRMYNQLFQSIQTADIA